jgi:hypothetical protein
VSQKASNFLNKLLQSSISLMNVALNSKSSPITNNKSGKVLILANGPSINTSLENPETLAAITKIDSLCVNYFYKSEFFYRIKPIYYIIAAPEMWEMNVGDDYKKNRDDMFASIAKNIDWEMTFFIPFEAKKTLFWQNILSDNPNIKIEYYNIVAIEGFIKMSHRLFGRKKGMPRSHNIVGYALMILIWKGYKEVGLLGVEHSWTKSLMVTDDNETFLTQPHFYSKNVKQVKMNKGVSGQDKFYLTFKAYHEINDFAIKKGVSIYTLTKDSFIDAYEKKDENEFLF